MTAIYMAVGQNGVLMLSDGAAYDDDGIMRQMHTKQLVAPDLNLVLSASGSGPALQFIRLHMARDNPLTFDAFHQNFPSVLREIMTEMDAYFGNKNYAAMLYGGYSESSEKYVGYLIATYDLENGGPKAFVPTAVTVFAKPSASDEMAAQYDLNDDAYDRHGPLDYGLRFMLAVRKSPYDLHGPDTTHGHGVGGFVEQTFLQKDCANTRILWRWPDEIGRAIDPSNDPEINIVRE